MSEEEIAVLVEQARVLDIEYHPPMVTRNATKFIATDPSRIKQTTKYFLKSVHGGNLYIVEHNDNPLIGRIIITWDWEKDIQAAKGLLSTLQSLHLPKVKYLITCGGFIERQLEHYVSDVDVKNPSDEFMMKMREEAVKTFRSLLSPELKSIMRRICRFLSIGIDFTFYFKQRRIEFVLLCDLETDAMHLTGKSYPTGEQQHDLIEITDYESHFMNLAGDNVMVLGCHDLSMFYNRSIMNSGQWRNEVQTSFMDLLDKHKPTIVLQHPHTSVLVKTWKDKWGGLLNNSPQITNFASAGLFFDKERPNRDVLRAVLDATKHGEVMNVLVFNEY